MAAPAVGAYSFLNVTAHIVGPGINMTFTGAAEEGYSIEMRDEKNTMTVGAGGDVMHSLHASQAGTLIFRALKTSAMNRALSNNHKFTRLSAANHGQIVITIRDPVRGDTIVAVGAAYRRMPNIAYAREGNIHEWAFDCASIDETFGGGALNQTTG